MKIQLKCMETRENTNQNVWFARNAQNKHRLLWNRFGFKPTFYNKTVPQYGVLRFQILNYIVWPARGGVCMVLAMFK